MSQALEVQPGACVSRGGLIESEWGGERNEEFAENKWLSLKV